MTVPGALSLLLAALFAGEAGLQLASWAASRRLESRSGAADARRAGFRVLCLGDSMTAPTLGTEDESWPSQLREILRLRHPGLEAAVLNKARPGASTAGIVAITPDYIDRYRPDVVISMMGVNDQRWFGIVAFDEPSPWRRLLRRSRLASLARHLAEARAVRPPAEAAPAGMESCMPLLREPPSLDDASGSACSALRSRHPDSPVPYEALTNYHWKRGERDLAKRMAAAAYRRGSRQARTNFLLGIVRHDDPEAALAFFSGCADAARAEGRPSMQQLCAMHGAAMIHVAKGRLGLARESAMAGLAGDPDWRGDGFTVRAARDETESASTANYRTLRELTRAGGLPLIAMQYPGWKTDSLRAALPAEGVTFVDNKTDFDRRLARRPYAALFTDRFAGTWGHCTAEGNRIIAENAAEALEPFLAAAAGGRPRER